MRQSIAYEGKLYQCNSTGCRGLGSLMVKKVQHLFVSLDWNKTDAPGKVPTQRSVKETPWSHLHPSHESSTPNSCHSYGYTVGDLESLRGN
ncbi:hypothetical protein TNCV_3965511 [Trichonephila clavipes]|nr:hypothetical protein TNCV_3965511 [Trichonephila clavipes]